MNEVSRYLVRVVVDGREAHLIEWSYPGPPLDPELVINHVAPYWIRTHGWDLTFEVRRDGEPWTGRRHRIVPAFEVVEP